MSPRTEEQFEIIRNERKDRIKQVALELFANEGYHATSISKIAKQANISKGLLYNYYESKEELLKEIIHEATDKIYVYLDPDHDGKLTEDEFFYFLSKNWKIIEENKEYYKLYTAMVLQPSVLSLIEHDFDDLSEKTTKLLYDFFLEKGFENPEEEMFILAFIIKGAILQYITYPKQFNITKIESMIKKHYQQKFENIKLKNQ